MEIILIMINTIKKFEINSSTYLFILLYFLCGYIKNILIIYLIVSIHEMGHILMSFLCGYKVKKITIYPFGGITKTETPLNSPLNKDLIIFLGGFIFQIILFFVTKIIYNLNFINYTTLNLIVNYNKFIFLFNLIPIIPLDGYLILNNIFNNIYSYNTSLWISLIISIISLIIFIFLYQNNFVIISFLILNIINYLKNINSLYNRFILERYLHAFPYSKIVYYNKQNLKKLKRGKYCYFKNKNKYISEKILLNKKFDNQGRF